MSDFGGEEAFPIPSPVQRGRDEEEDEDEIEEDAVEGVEEDEAKSVEHDENTQMNGDEEPSHKGQDDAEKSQAKRAFFEGFNRLMRSKVDAVFDASKKHTLETLQEYDENADKPGALVLVVSPQGATTLRFSKSLNSMPLVGKYVKRLAWAIEVSLQTRKFETTEKDLGDVDLDSFPPGLQQENQENNAQPARRENHRNERTKRLAVLLIGEKKKQLQQMVYPFCKSGANCHAEHDDCRDQRALWGWPAEVPFIHTKHLRQGYLDSLIAHYAKEFPNIVETHQAQGVQAQGARQRYVRRDAPRCLIPCDYVWLGTEVGSSVLGVQVIRT